jgi:hypothetical protein
MRQKNSQVPQRHYNRVKEELREERDKNQSLSDESNGLAMELKEEKKKNQKLSDENNRLARELRMVKIERDVLRRRVVDG